MLWFSSVFVHAPFSVAIWVNLISGLSAGHAQKHNNTHEQWIALKQFACDACACLSLFAEMYNVRGAMWRQRAKV